MQVGFSGTRFGMTLQQTATIEQWLALWQRTTVARCTLHHGDCVGADAEAHSIARQLGYAITIHPPLDDRHRAWCAQGGTGAASWFESEADGTTILPPLRHLARNRAIVQACDILLAAPIANPLPLRGGTPYTIRYARQQGCRTIVVWPDGTLG